MIIRLDNGVRIICEPITGLKSASVGVWVNIGTRHENETNNGIAHLLEHMVFKGAGSRNAKALAEDSEARGVYLNAATAYERTGYYARCLSNEVNFAFDLCADLVLEPHLTDEDLKLEKNVVIHEINEAFDDADDRAGVLAQMACFNNQALGRPILGDAQSLSLIDCSALKEFHKNYLNPENIIIAICGTYNSDSFIEAVKARFNDLKPIKSSELITAFSTKHHLFEFRKSEQFQLVLSGEAEKSNIDNLFNSQMLCTILSGGMASRLFQDLRENRGLVYGIDAYPEKYIDIGRINITAGCAPKNAKEVVERSLAHIEDLAINGPKQDEFSRAKKILETTIMMSFENPASRLNSIVTQNFVFGRSLDLDFIDNSIKSVSSDDIKATASQLLAINSRAASGVGHKIGEKALEIYMN